MKKPVLVVLTVVISFLISCTDKDSPNVNPLPRVIAMNVMYEKFDAEGSVQIGGQIAVGSKDTLQSIGFIYTDDAPTEDGGGSREPNIDSDHVVELPVTALTPATEENYYNFEATINPVRGKDASYTAAENTVVNIVLFIKTTSGKTLLGNTWQLIHYPKLNVISIYPAYAKPGEDVVVQLNRKLEDDGQIKPYASGMAPTQPNYPVKVIVGDEEVAVTSGLDVNHISSIITFKMPEGITEETEVKVTAGEYSVPAPVAIRNASVSLKLLTDKDRDLQIIFKPFLFAAPDAIFYGGSTDGNHHLKTDFWKYTISTNKWDRMADMPDEAPDSGMAWYYGNNAWLGAPAFSYKYDLLADAWTSVSPPASALQYDHTFDAADYGFYNGKIYFTHYGAESQLGAYWDYNHWSYNPANGQYQSQPTFPGTAPRFPGFNQAVTNNGNLHYFPGVEHWTFNSTSGDWTKLNDVDTGEHLQFYFKPFSFKDQLYGVLILQDRVGDSNKRTFKILKYDAANDAWLHDADLSAAQDIWVFSLDDDNVFVAAMTNTLVFYKIE